MDGKDGGAGNAVADGEVALVIHRGAAHPAIVRVRRLRRLFPDGPCAGGQSSPQLVVTNASLVRRERGAGADVDGVVNDQRLVAAEVSVLKPVHHPVANRIERRGRGGRRRLFDVVEAGGIQRVESRDWQRTVRPFRES